MFAGAARGAVFSNPDVVRRVNADFVPVALKAALVNGAPPGPEGALYREVGRSKPAPQGIAVANSAGKVLAWALMFDDDASVLGFLDYSLKRYASHPRGGVAAERFMKYPSMKMNPVEDDGQSLCVPERHPGGERCLGAPGFAEGTLVGRTVGRAFKDGKPFGETTRQEHYVEDRFELGVDAQEALAKALSGAGGGRFALPDALSRTLVATAHLGMLDVNPLGAPGGRNDRRKWDFWGRKDGARVRLEGTSDVAGGSGDDRGGQNADGRFWTHEITLTWKGSIEMNGDRVARLVAVASGREKLTWGNERMIREGESEVAHLPGGRVINLDCDVRYGFEARPAAGDEIGSGQEPGNDAPPQGAPAALQAKMQKLHEALQVRERHQQEIQRELQKLPPLVEKGDFSAAEKQIDTVLELLRKP